MPSSGTQKGSRRAMSPPTITPPHSNLIDIGHTLLQVLRPDPTDGCPVVSHWLSWLDVLVINTLPILVHDGHTGHDAFFPFGTHAYHLTIQGQGFCQSGGTKGPRVMNIMGWDSKPVSQASFCTPKTPLGSHGSMPAPPPVIPAQKE